MEDNPNLLPLPISDNPLNASDKRLKPSLKRNRIFNFIKEHPKCSMYEISQSLKISYGFVHKVVSDLVYMKFLVVFQSVDSQGRPSERFFIPSEVNV